MSQIDAPTLRDLTAVLAGLAILHVVLNWNWIKATFFRKPMAPKA